MKPHDRAVRLERPATRRGAWLAAGLIVAAACTGISTVGGCERQRPSGAAPIPRGVPVSVATVEMRDMPEAILAIGNVEPIAQVMLKPQVDGQLVEVKFAEGQDVGAGELMLVIDRRPFAAALAEAEARLARNRAVAEDAQLAAEQMAEALKGRAMSQRETDKARADAAAAVAQVAADVAAAEAAKLRLEYCEIRAPIAGRAGSLLAKVGNVVEAGQTELVEINQIAPIYVSFAVPEQNLARIKAEQSRALLALQVTIPGDEAEPISGALTFIDNKVDSTTGTIRLKGTFVNVDRRLWPGQFVTIVLVVATERGAVVAPSAAVQTNQNGQFVFVVKPDQSVEQRPVVVARTVEQLSVIRQGLTGGETVVTDGQLRLVPGATVEIVHDRQAQQDDRAEPMAERRGA